MQDDIDWMNASSDFGLAKLCQELATLARPMEALMKRPVAGVRRVRRIAVQRGRAA